MDMPLPAETVIESAEPAPPVHRGLHWLGAALLVLLGGAALAGYLQWSHPAPPAYRFATAIRGPITAAVIASGTVNPVTNVQVGSQVSGQILQLCADFNSQVHSGDLVARIDPALFQTQVAQATADLAVSRANIGVQQATVQRAEADLAAARATAETLQAQTDKARAAAQDTKRIADRARRLAETGAGTIADRDTTEAIYDQAAAQVHTAQAQEVVQQATIRSAEAALAVAQANLTMSQAQASQKQAALDNAQVNLAHTEIHAPVDGTVVLRNVDVGQTVVASLQSPLLFTIAQDLRRMQVDVSVDEADVGGVKGGQIATFTVDAYPGRTFQGSVQQVRIAPQVVQNVVTYDVVVSAPNPDAALVPGLTANVRLVTDHRDDALLVPNAALRYRVPGVAAGQPKPGSGEVWVMKNQKPVAVPLRLGISDGNTTEVRDGALAAGTPVVIGDQPKQKANQSSPGVMSGPRI